MTDEKHDQVMELSLEDIIDLDIHPALTEIAKALAEQKTRIDELEEQTRTGRITEIEFANRVMQVKDYKRKINILMSGYIKENIRRRW